MSQQGGQGDARVMSDDKVDSIVSENAEVDSPSRSGEIRAGSAMVVAQVGVQWSGLNREVEGREQMMPWR